MTSPLLLMVLLGAAPQVAQAESTPASETRQLRVFLDCDSCFSEYLRSEITFIDYVRDRAEADIHLLITRTGTGSGGHEYTAEFIGNGTFAGTRRTFKTITTRSDSEEIIRRQIANAVRLGLLTFVAQEGVPQQLELMVELGSERARPAVTGDRWRNWVFSVRGSASFEGEESNRELQLRGALSADRITPDWKITLGSEMEHEHQRFDIDEEEGEPFEIERREREFNWLAVKGLGDHWSVGATGAVVSSTFENTSVAASAAPAVEYNVFPYSQYTRRQLRILYRLGARAVQYHEETLFGKTEETLVQQHLSATYDQRERWGTLEARVEWLQYLHDLDLSRLRVDAEVSLRVARGFSVTGEINASRIRDQLSIPSRGATPEEILLELRQLRSGYEYEFSLGVTYTFGSIFSSVVNPRFGR